MGVGFTNLANDVSAQVAASLTRYNMLSARDRVGVAVSGGADSVTLLHVLHTLSSGPVPCRLVVLHVNHQLRGVESNADEEFVRALAAKLGLPLEVKLAPLGPGNVEQSAREARRAFFFAVKERLALRCIALGHNQSDQAETVLYRFLRGSGLAGLAGMLPVTADGLIRPLLQVTREEIRAWAAAQGLSWREDSSNEKVEIVRNRMRLQVFNPRLVQVLSANAEIARDEEAWWAGRISDLYASLARLSVLGLQFSVTNLTVLHVAEQRRLLRHAVRQIKGDLRSIDLAHIESVRALTASEAGHDRVLIPGVDILRSFNTLLLAKPGRLGNEPRHYQKTLEIGQERALPFSGGRLYVNWVKLDGHFCGNFGVEVGLVRQCTDCETADLDGEILKRAGDLDELLVRNWEPGDEYRRAGHEKPEKIKSLFQEYRIVLWDRRRWPVMVLKDEIVWSPRFGVAAGFQAGEESRSVLRLVFVPEANVSE